MAKKFGEEILFSLNDAVRRATNCYPTGIMSLDYALGVGGLPPGRIIEIYGPESGGKSTTALKIVASCQKFFKTHFEGEQGCAFIDVEHSLDPAWGILNGVDFDDLLISQPDSAEQALDVVESLVMTDKVKLIVLDSVAALVPLAEAEGEMGDQQIGLQARLMSKAMRKLTGIAASRECTLVFINQIREKVGVMYGSNETTTGGRALRFYASIRIEVRRGEPIKNGKDQIGNGVNIRIVKNKVAAPYKQAQFDIRYDIGIDAAKDIFNIAKTIGVIQGGGAWFSYEDNKWNGAEKAATAIREDEELAKKLAIAIKSCLRGSDEVVVNA
jgi:recombination protein RecA